ncbi:putative 4-coumarate--CoA ligase 1 [Grifola frondosa]|uniref:Putative 4-coumarate--CoA ligase 1 n=1 Tax=Grifola frondosa TaxID=5627 RepID=A0A1C7LXP8_GRIFR|nr:putative 4-coumarate--CoA ligase 1 [Grifola frondosa]
MLAGMHYKSLFPPVPPLPEQNAHDFILDPMGQGHDIDHVLHVDASTGRKRTRREFKQRVRDAATALVSPPSDGGFGIGIDQGEIIGILSHNCLEYITLVYSSLATTIPFALISAYSTPFELVHSLRVAKATRLFVHPSLLSGALRAAREIGLSEEHIYILEGHVKDRRSLGEAIEEVRRRQIPRVPVKPARRDTLAYLVFSSGTSGLPKAVMISHGNIIYSLVQTIISAKDDPVPDGPPNVVLAFLPFYHTYGLHYLCLRGMLAPATFVVVSKWDVDAVLSLIPKFRITVLPLIPSAIHQIVNHKRIRKVDFSSVTTIGSGAAYLPPQLAAALQSLVPSNPRIGEGYGMSELTISAMRTPTPTMLGGRIEAKVGSCGLLLPGMEARIVRADGSLAGLNEPGELWLKGGNVALGYWGNEKATKETFVDGWLRTGDTVRADEDQVFFFDTLKVSGVQVSPTELEDLLIAHPDKLIIDACVAGVSGGRTSDEKVPRAWVVLSERGKRRGDAAVIKALTAWSQQNLSKYKWLRGGLQIVDQIPKNPTGKVLRRVLQDRYEESHSSSRAKL